MCAHVKVSVWVDVLVGVSEALSVLAKYVEMQAVEGGLLTG